MDCPLCEVEHPRGSDRRCVEHALRHVRFPRSTEQIYSFELNVGP